VLVVAGELVSPFELRELLLPEGLLVRKVLLPKTLGIQEVTADFTPDFILDLMEGCFVE